MSNDQQGIVGSVQAVRARRERGAVIAIFLLFAGWYLLLGSGHFYATDEETVYNLTESLVERHTLSMPNGAWGLATTTGRDGRQYAVTGPGQSFLAVPLYWLGAATAPILPREVRGYATRFVVSLFNPLVTAATVALLYALARRLGVRGGAALGLAAIYGLATTAWPHGRTFFAEPLTAFLLLLTWYSFRRGTEAMRSFPWLVGGGAALVAAMSVKPHAALAVPFLGLYLLVRATGIRMEGSRPRVEIRRAVPLVLAAGLGGFVAALPLGLYNWQLFGNPLQTGYGGQSADDLFVVPFMTGFFGLTISTGKGLLLYSPPVLLGLAGWWIFFRRWWADALLCLGIVAAHFAFYSRLSAWHGDGSWGPRYLMVMLPFAVVPLVVVLDGLRVRPIRLAAVSAIVGAGVVIQLLGLLVNFDWYIVRSNQNARFFTPAASPVLAHARILGERVSLWQGRLFPSSDSAVMIGGFYAAEPPPERPTTRPGLYPRWTDGDGVIVLHPAERGPLTVKLTFFEDRPPALRTERPSVLLNGIALAESAVTREDLTGDGGGWIYQFTVPAASIVGGETRVTLQSTTWNPHQAGLGDRDEVLGVFVHNIEVWQGGRAFAVTEALPIDPMPQTPRQRFWWHNDDRNYWDLRRHLVDHWGWYLAVAGFPRGGAIAWAATYGGGAFVLLLAGILLGRGYLPAPQARRADKRRRPASRKGVGVRTGKRIA